MRRARACSLRSSGFIPRADSRMLRSSPRLISPPVRAPMSCPRARGCSRIYALRMDRRQRTNSRSSISQPPSFDRFSKLSSPTPPGRMRSCTLAIVPAGNELKIARRWGSAVIISHGIFSSVQAALYRAAVAGISFAISLPRSGGSNCSRRPLRSLAGNPRGFGDVHTKAAHGLAVAEVDELHGDDLVDDGGEFASGLAALELRAPFDEAIEVVDDALEHGNEHDVLSAGVLQLLQPMHHLPTVQPVSAARVFRAGARGGRLRLLLGVTKRDAR